MEEVWKDIINYEGFYQISNFGNVKSIERWDKYKRKHGGKILKPYKTKQNRLLVDLCKDGSTKSMYVHRLVAVAFIPNPNNYPEVNHRDENPINNNINNLEWCTRLYNINYGTRNARVSQKLLGNKNALKRIGEI